MNQKRIWYQRIRKQSTPTVKPIILLLKLLGTITIDYGDIVVHNYSTACLVPDVSLQDTRKHRVLWDAISTALVELAGQREPHITINNRWTVESPQSAS
jgi:hypothetical protein